ncbi:MAG: SPOR domain-containing protein [Alphaproteobacteria bacterium]
MTMSTLLLSGCVVPVAVSIASYSFDGLAYGATGKSVSDMALSQATDQDCSMWRVVRGGEICRDYTPAQRHEMALAAAEANNYDGESRRASEPTYALVPKRSHDALVAEVNRTEAEAADRASASIATLDKKTPDKKAGGTATIAFAADGSGDIEVVPLAPLIEPKQATPTPPIAASTPEEGHPVAATTPATAHAKPAMAQRATVAAAAPASVRAMPIPRPTQKPVMVTAAPAPASAHAAPTRAEAHADGAYIVLASFTSRAHAESGLALYASAKPSVAVTSIDGKEVYRVVSGPYRAQELAKVRAKLAKTYDLSHSWTMQHCTGACTVALWPERGTPQLATLPGRI